MRAPPGYVPTPYRIAEACAVIRQQWSHAERQRRMVGYECRMAQQVWLPPRIDTSRCMARVRNFVVEPTA